MRNFAILVILILLLSGCTSPTDSIAWSKSKFYKVEGEKIVYFQYPDAGSVDGDVIKFDNCKIKFGKFGMWNSLLESEGRRIESKKISYDGGGSGVLENWFDDMKVVVLDAGGREDFNIGFWIFNDGQQTNYECRVALENLINSVSDKPVYQNDQFGFIVSLSPSYKAESMPSKEGVLMKKFVDKDADWIIPDKEGNRVGYVVEISFFGEDNIMEFPDLTALLIDKYTGFDKEFVGDAVYVNEGSGDYSIRHYYIMSGKSIIRGMLRVDSRYYNHHKDEFDALVKGFKLI